MPSKIRVLSENTINKIAAGEVIENPASVVKELIENSLDAGSTDICVEIAGGGRQLIRVTDNGCGMNNDDAILCLERHATSKIREVEDINAINTMGFRGEAIPSIASISKFTLLTCPAKETEADPKATMIIVDGGQLGKCCSAERSQGTTIEVKSLFFNVPVRRKFQKSPAHDTNEILRVMSILSLGNPQIKFKLISHHETLLVAPVGRAESFLDIMRERIALTLGNDFAGSMLGVETSHEECSLKGFIGKPHFNRHNRTGQYLFINQRPVISPIISSLLREGYGTTLGTHRHPVFVLHLTLPGSLIDVNVHPQKKEVRLRQEEMIRKIILEGIERALQRMPATPMSISLPLKDHEEIPAQISKSPEEPLPWDLPWKNSEEPVQPTYIVQPQKTNSIELIPTLERRIHPEVNPSPPQFQEASFLPVPISRPSLRVLETLNNFIIATDHHAIGKLCILDQQAAHQRILYEGLLKKQHPSDEIQSLLIPVTLELTYFEAAIVREYLEGLQAMGIGIQEFGRNTFVVDAVPSFLKQGKAQEVISEIIQNLQDSGSSGFMKMEKSKRLAMIASRMAISCDERLSQVEAQKLVDQLMGCETPFQCPLGKTIMATINADDIRNQFFK